MPPCPGHPASAARGTLPWPRAVGTGPSRGHQGRRSANLSQPGTRVQGHARPRARDELVPLCVSSAERPGAQHFEYFSQGRSRRLRDPQTRRAEAQNRRSAQRQIIVCHRTIAMEFRVGQIAILSEFRTPIDKRGSSFYHFHLHPECGAKTGWWRLGVRCRG